MATLKVLMFPFLAYGHISPYLNVAKKLADRGFLIYFISTPINLKSTINKIPEKYADSIQLIELHLPELPELPPHYHTTNGLPPNLNHILQKALKMSKPNFSKILENLKPDLVIYDIMQQWAERVANEHNIPAVKLITSGASVFSYLFNILRKPEVEFPFPAIYLRKIEKVRLSEMVAKSNKSKEPDDGDRLAEGNMQIMLMSTSRTIEEKYIEDALPKGFLERIGERGRVLDKFAPQPRILNHPSTGGFISHSGWNSAMESIDFGVPIIAMSMHLDQPMVARLIVELGVAVEIVRDDDGKIHKGEIAETLKAVITEETGEKLRAKVRDISKNLKSIRDEEMDAAAEELIQLCRNSNK